MLEDSRYEGLGSVWQARGQTGVKNEAKVGEKVNVSMDGKGLVGDRRPQNGTTVLFKFFPRLPMM